MERRPYPIQASDRSDSPRSDSVVDAPTSLALWLRAGRAHRGMSLDDVARVTKIQPRILERLETGKLEGLPAEVFVRGFVRSFARCVGLDEREALRRYAACAVGTQDLTPTVRALVEVMSDLAPGSASAARATPRQMAAVEVIDLSPPAPAARSSSPDLAELAAPAAAAAVEPPAASSGSSKKKRGRRRKARAMAARESAAGIPRAPLAVGTPPTASPIVAAPAPAGEPVPVEPAAAAPVEPVAAAPVEPASPASIDASLIDAAIEAAPESAQPVSSAVEPAPVEPGEVHAAASSRQLPIAAPSVPWRRSASRIPTSASGQMAAASVPSLVIDDADPESAERVLEERAEILAPRRSFLPPILLDREDRSARQGGLTLAVILLLIAATLTLSYLMRRPSASGDGMTGRAVPAQRIG